jgi:uncharacterized membrane protein
MYRPLANQVAMSMTLLERTFTPRPTEVKMCAEVAGRSARRRSVCYKGPRRRGDVMTLVLALLIGLLAGLRSLTAPAAVALGTRLGWLHPGSGLAWIGSTPAVVVFVLAALLELVADKLPSTPRRTSPPGLIARIVMGGLAGAAVASGGGHSGVMGALVGIVGALAGTYGGYEARRRLVQALGTPDFVIAVLEDLVAILGSLWVVSRF